MRDSNLNETIRGNASLNSRTYVYLCSCEYSAHTGCFRKNATISNVYENKIKLKASNI